MAKVLASRVSQVELCEIGRRLAGSPSESKENILGSLVLWKAAGGAISTVCDHVHLNPVRAKLIHFKERHVCGGETTMMSRGLELGRGGTGILYRLTRAIWPGGGDYEDTSWTGPCNPDGERLRDALNQLGLGCRVKRR